MAIYTPPGTPPYEGAPPDERIDPGAEETGGEFLQRTHETFIPMERYGDGPQRMSPIQTPLQTAQLPGMSPNSVPQPTLQPPPPQDLAAGQQQASRAPGSTGVRVHQPEFSRAIAPGEFYQGQERPANYRTSGGDQIWVASGGRIPFSVLADRDMALKKKRADLDEAIKKLAGGDDFKGKAAPPYERAYQSYVGTEQARYVDDWAKAYHGGDRNSAMKDLATNAESNRQYQSFLRDLAAVGEVNKYKYDQYEKLYTDVLDNKAWVAPDTRRELEKFLTVDPYNSGQTTAQLHDGYKRLEHQVSRDELWNNTYLPRISKEFDTLQQEGSVITKGGRRFLSQTKTENLDRVKEQAIRDMVQKYGVGSEAEIRQYVEANMPKYSVTELDHLPIGSVANDGKRSGWNNGAYDTGTGIRAVPESRTLRSIPKEGGGVQDVEIDTIRIYRDVDGEQVDLKPQDFLTDTDAHVLMKPTRLIKDDGKWFIEGTVYGRPREKTVKAEKGGGSDSVTNLDEEVTAEATAGEPTNTEFVPLRTDRVPLSRNKEFRANYVDPDRIMSEFKAGRTGPVAVNNQLNAAPPAPPVAAASSALPAATEQAAGTTQAKPVADQQPDASFFKGGTIVKSDMGGTPVWYVMSPNGMNKISDYFTDEQSAKLVKKAFDSGDIREEHIAKNSRRASEAFKKLHATAQAENDLY